MLIDVLTKKSEEMQDYNNTKNKTNLVTFAIIAWLLSLNFLLTLI